MGPWVVRGPRGGWTLHRVSHGSSAGYYDGTGKSKRTWNLSGITQCLVTIGNRSIHAKRVLPVCFVGICVGRSVLGLPANDLKPGDSVLRQRATEEEDLTGSYHG